MATDLMRALSRLRQINQFWGRGWNKYHSIQSTFNRRFSNGVSFGLNWTLGLVNTTNSGARLEHGTDGSLQYRADQDEADELLGRGQLQRHTFKGNFVWDLPDLDGSDGAARSGCSRPSPTTGSSRASTPASPATATPSATATRAAAAT